MLTLAKSAMLGACMFAPKQLGRSGLPKNCSFVLREFRGSPPFSGSIRGRFGKIRGQEKPLHGENLTIDVGRAALMGAAAVGIGGLCLYGLYGGRSKEGVSALERATIWPDYVRQRIRATYTYLAGGAAIAGATAISLSRSATFLRLMASGGWIAPIGMLVFSLGSGVVCQMLPYQANGLLDGKHLSWLVYAASLGGVLAPICLLGGPILTHAAVYTGGIVGGLSAIAASAPSDRFLTWSGPLAMGLGVVFVSSLGSMFLSPMGRLGAGMAAVSLYGGLLVFSGFLLYDTQMVIRRAEEVPPFVFPSVYAGQIASTRPFDPINSSIHILLDTINIFVRMVIILSGGGSRRK